MRCPDCETFVSLDTEVEPEENNEPEYRDGCVDACYRRVLACADCGTELAEAGIAFEIVAPLDHEDDCDEDFEIEITDVVVEPFEARVRIDTPEGHKRRKRVVYGVELSGTLRCDTCGVEREFSGRQYVPASAFDSLV